MRFARSNPATANDRNRVYVAGPNVDFDPGTAITWSAADDDVLDADEIGVQKTTFGGRFPFRASIPGATVECRAMDRPGVLARVAPQVTALEEALRRLDELHPSADATAPKDSDEEPARGLLRTLGARLGWSDPCTLGWIEQVSAFAHRYADEARPFVAAVGAKRLVPGREASLSLAATMTVLDAVCDRPIFDGIVNIKVDCRVEAILKNRSDSTKDVSELCDDDCALAGLLFENGRGSAVELVGLYGKSRVLGGSAMQEDAERNRLGTGVRFGDLGYQSVGPNSSIRVTYLGRARVRADLLEGYQPVEVAITSGLRVRLRPMR